MAIDPDLKVSNKPEIQPRAYMRSVLMNLGKGRRPSGLQLALHKNPNILTVLEVYMLHLLQEPQSVGRTGTLMRIGARDHESIEEHNNISPMKKYL